MPATTKEFQSNFNTGELSKKGQARIEIARYPAGLKTCEHAIVLPVGGVTRRPGFRFAQETKNSETQDSVLIPYDAGQGLAFMLEFGDLYMRVFNQDGTLILLTGGSELILNGGFPTDIASWADLSSGGGIFEWHSATQSARLRTTTAGDIAYMEQAITTVIGKEYEINFEQVGNPAGAFTLRVGTTSGGAELEEKTLGSGSHTFKAVATATTHYIGFKQIAPTANLGSEILINGGFDTDSDWTDEDTGTAQSTIMGGTLVLFGSDAVVNNIAKRQQAISTISGQTYVIEIDISFVLGNNGRLAVGSASLATDLLNQTGLGVGTHSFEFTATGTTSYIQPWMLTTAFSFEIVIVSVISVKEKGLGTRIDNVSVKELGANFDLVTTIPQAELGDLQYAQLEDGMQILSDGVKLHFLVPASASSWAITAEDWKNSKAIAGGTGANIGDMTTGGGLAAAFDGDSLKTKALSAQGAAGVFINNIGKDWGAGNERAIKGVQIWSSSDGGFWDESAVEVIMRVQGSTDNFAASTVTLAEFVLPSDITKVTKLEIFNLNDIRTAYRYHRVQLEVKSATGASISAIALLEFFELVAENPPGLNDSSSTFAPAIGRFQQRSITGGQPGRPATVYGTKSADPFNMGQGAADAADAFQHELISTSLIRWFLESDDLLIGTSHGVTRMLGTTGPLTASDKEARPDVAIGCAPILPAKMGNSALYIQTDRQRVQEVKIDDQGVKLIASDMSQLADHIGDTKLNGSKFKGLAAQPDPNKVLWGYLDNGRLVGLTFDRQESLFGWHQHPMANGQVISLRALRAADGRTDIWAIIKRTINGATKRSVEIQDPDVFSDGAVKYSGVPAITIVGLDHLEGETVTVYGDGYNRGTFVVAGGLINLQDTMTTGDIGLGFTPKIEPVSPIRGFGRKRRFGPVLVELENTQSLWVNGKQQSFRKGKDTMGAGVKFTGKKRVTVLGWSRDPTLTFEGREPGPWTILGYSGIMGTGR